MKTEFIRHTHGSRRLLLIFTGWSASALTHRQILPATAGDWDILVASDYDGVPFETALLDGYTTIYLLAWSLGVAAAERWVPAERLTAAFAVNGTPWPVDARRGIDPEIFAGTESNLSERNLLKFRIRMAGSTSRFKEVARLFPDDDDILSLRSQLRGFMERTPMRSIKWTRAFISTDDHIFTCQAQLNAWNEILDQADILVAPGDHLPDFNAIIHSCIPDTAHIGACFSSASATYESNASAQRIVADKLIRMLAEANPRRGVSTLEIGPGTGLLTRMYGPLLCPAESTFVDLYKVQPFHIAPEEHYSECDAELWMERCQRRFDVILSSSSIQWLANQRNFFTQAARLLEDGGLLAVSTFSQGNLEELDRIRPSRLHYPTVADVTRWLEADFELIEMSCDSIGIDFDTPRQALMHIRRTGVAGTPARHLSPSASPLSRLHNLANLPGGRCRLTYRPLLLIARRIHR